MGFLLWVCMRSIIVPILLTAYLGLGVAQAQSASRTIAAPTLPDFTSFVVTRPENNRLVPITLEEAGHALKAYDVVLVGEHHGHIANHLAQMALLRSIHRATPQLALSMEQFERDHQSRVDDYLAGVIGEQTLVDGGGWKNYAQSYRPLVEYAKEHRLPVIAANAPRSIVRCVGREGPDYLKTLSADKRKLVAAELHVEDGIYKQKFLKFMRGDAAHEDATDTSDKAKRARIENSFAAQMTRDDTMAESIANFLGRHPGIKVFHITGSFHVADRLGTLERLSARAPNLKVALIMPLPLNPSDLAGGISQDAKGADYVILIRREPEPHVTDGEKKAAHMKQAGRYRSAGSAGCKS